MNSQGIHTEKVLLDKIAAGDELAFAHLLDEYRGKVFSHVLTYVKGYDEAVEIVQDIFIKIWVQRERLTEVRDFPSYLFIISRNYLVSSIRKRVIDHSTIDDNDMLHEVARPDNSLEAKELEKHIAAALEHMPLQQKIVFKLSRQERLSQQEISDKMKITKRTVKFHMAAALNFLRIYLKDIENGLRFIIFLSFFL